MAQTEQLELRQEYYLRFSANYEYRNRVWRTLTSAFFQQYIDTRDTVLDLGSGWGEFVNNIHAGTKYAMDLNPDGAQRVDSDVHFLNQDCSHRWNVGDDTLDAVFTSNFFEHLPSKAVLSQVLVEAHRCMKPGALLICLGPNFRYAFREYWDFWDHHVPLSDRSLVEALRLRGFRVDKCWPRFLPYTMTTARPVPQLLIRAYLSIPWAWSVFGKQFLILARAVK